MQKPPNTKKFKKEPENFLFLFWIKVLVHLLGSPTLLPKFRKLYQKKEKPQTFDKEESRRVFFCESTQPLQGIMCA